MTIFLSEDTVPVNLNDSPSLGPLRAEDLDRTTNTGRIYHLHRAVVMPAGLDQQGRYETRQFPDTIPTDYSELERLDGCAIEGGKPRAPVAAPRRSWLCSAWLALVRKLT